MLKKTIPALLSFFLAVLPALTGHAQEVARIKTRVVNDLLAPPVNKTAIQQLVQTIRPDGTWPGINYADTSRTGFQHKQHLDNMLELARAYQKNGSGFYQDDGVKKTFSAALDYWLDHDFRCQNWWWNEMGTPNLMINTLLVMDNGLTERQRTEGMAIAHRANMETFGARPGGDLMPIAGMLAKQGLFLNNADTLQKALKAMAADIKTSTGRGLKPDKSFHHRTDNVISTLTYGTNYASSFAYWAARIQGAGFSFPDSSLHLIIDYFLDGICQSLVYATYPDPGAMNRDISRRNALEAEDISLPQNLLQATAGNYRGKELETILQVRKEAIKPSFTRDRYFWYSHYYSHQRPAYFASARMHSARANNMEEPHNEEGIKNHFYGDGSFFLTRTTHEYENIFPVWDWRKIPGTTIVQKTDIPHWRQLARKGKTEFSGGVSDGRYGVAAFDFASVHDSLTARKSWFFFDQEIVCLGAGIRSPEPYPVATTLNQCLLKGNVVVQSKGAVATLKAGAHELPGVSWVLHDSVAYVFSQPASVHINNQAVTGNWRSITHQAWATADPIRENLFTLWLDHGQQPQQAGYAYIVVPNTSQASIASYQQQMPAKIIANNSNLQAVQHAGLGRTSMVFYKPGTVSISKLLALSATEPCMVMVHTKAGAITSIAVADPTQKLTALSLKVSARITGSGPQWKSRYDAATRTSTLQINLPADAYAGQTVLLDIASAP